MSRPQELQANANAESASVNVKPPCPIACPLTMSSRTVIRSVAAPGGDLDELHAERRLARSPAHIGVARCAAGDLVGAHSGFSISADQVLLVAEPADLLVAPCVVERQGRVVARDEVHLRASRVYGAATLSISSYT